MNTSSSAKRNLFLAIIIMVGCVTQIATDIFTPSIPFIASGLHASITSVQWTIPVYTCTVALAILFYGPLSEVIGRKKALIFGLLVFMLGCLVSVISKNINMLIFSRCLQGLGAGACGALWRAIFRDAFSGEQLAKYSSVLTLFVIFIVPTAPMIGGFLQQHLFWQANFSFMLAYAALVLLLVIFFYKESNIHRDSERRSINFLLKTYKHVFTHRLFMGYSLSVFLSFGALSTWLITSPVLLIKHAGMSPAHYGILSFWMGVISMFSASRFNSRFVERWGSGKMLCIGWAIMTFSGVMMLIGAYLLPNNIIAIAVPMLIFNFGATLIWPNAFASAFAPFGHIAGYVAAAYSFMQMSGATVLGGIAAHIPETTQQPLAWVLIISPISAWLVYWFMARGVAQPTQK